MIVRLTWDLLLLEAEILFLRRQLALYRERGGRSRGGWMRQLES